MTSQGTAHGRFQRDINGRNVLAEQMAAREMGDSHSPTPLALRQLLANVDPARYERAALRWLHRFVDERLPPLTEVELAASALAELRTGIIGLCPNGWISRIGWMRCSNPFAEGP
jgi:hypothetical protein